jgi:hypothetical protein
LVFFSGYHDIPWAFQALLKLEKNSTADIISWLTAPRWRMIWGCFRSFALHRIRVLPDLMMDTHRCIAIGRNCSFFRITRFHFRLFGILCCSCACDFLCFIGWLLLVCFCASLVYILSSAIVFL